MELIRKHNDLCQIFWRCSSKHCRVLRTHWVRMQIYVISRKKIKNIVDDMNSTHPLRQRLLKLVIEQTFVNSSLSSQRLKNRKKNNYSIRRRKSRVYCECLEEDPSLFSNIPSAKNNSESCYITL